MKKVLSVTVSVLFTCVLSCPLLFVEDAAAEGLLPLGESCEEANRCLEECNGIGDPLDVVMCRDVCQTEYPTCLNGDVQIQPVPPSVCQICWEPITDGYLQDIRSQDGDSVFPEGIDFFCNQTPGGDNTCYGLNIQCTGNVSVQVGIWEQVASPWGDKRRGVYGGICVVF